MCEHNETQNVIKAEQHAMKFEETVDNIKRQQKAEEFRQAQCVAVTSPCCCALRVLPAVFSSIPQTPRPRPSDHTITNGRDAGAGATLPQDEV